MISRKFTWSICYLALLLFNLGCSQGALNSKTMPTQTVQSSISTQVQVQVERELILGSFAPPSDDEGLNVALPKFLTNVNPDPKETISQQDYDQQVKAEGREDRMPGICLGYDPVDLVEDGEFPSQEGIIDWITVSIGEVRDLPAVHLFTYDSSEVTIYAEDDEGNIDLNSEPIAVAPWGSPYGLCYAAPLGPGYHVVELTVKNGDQLKGEYSWSFQIVE